MKKKLDINFKHILFLLSIVVLISCAEESNVLVKAKNFYYKGIGQEYPSSKLSIVLNSQGHQTVEKNVESYGNPYRLIIYYKFNEVVNIPNIVIDNIKIYTKDAIFFQDSNIDMKMKTDTRMETLGKYERMFKILFNVKIESYPYSFFSYRIDKLELPYEKIFIELQYHYIEDNVKKVKNINRFFETNYNEVEITGWDMIMGI